MKRVPRIYAGPGVRIRKTPFGDVLRFDGGRQIFEGAWTVTLLDETAATIAPGTVNRVEGQIKGLPLTESPLLEFGRLKVDKEGRGYICVEVTCKPEEDWRIVKAEMVQVADPDTEDGAPGAGSVSGTGAAVPLSGNRARYAVAMLRRRDDGRLDVYQIAYFPLQHRVSLAADGKSAQRHFFW